jgi:hypothetical protein
VLEETEEKADEDNMELEVLLYKPQDKNKYN